MVWGTYDSANKLYLSQEISVEENEYKCFGGEKKILSPWKPNSTKSTLKPIEYFFTPNT